jgi:hypothetical protein
MVEAIVYISLTAFMVVLAMSFTIDVTRAAARIVDATEVQQNSRMALTRIDQEIKTAEAVISSSGSELRLRAAGGTAVRFYRDAAAGRVYFDDGVTDTALTGDNVNVPSLLFETVGEGVLTTLTVTDRRPSSGSPNAYTKTFVSYAFPRTPRY